MYIHVCATKWLSSSGIQKLRVWLWCCMSALASRNQNRIFTSRQVLWTVGMVLRWLGNKAYSPLINVIQRQFAYIVFTHLWGLQGTHVHCTYRTICCPPSCLCLGVITPFIMSLRTMWPVKILITICIAGKDGDSICLLSTLQVFCSWTPQVHTWFCTKVLHMCRQG